MVYIYIFTMAIVTYLIRMLPLTLSRKKITNRYVKSFLYYVPYACLMAMTFPAVFYLSGNDPTISMSAVVGVCVAIVLALWEKGLVTVSVAACIVVYLMERIL